MRQQPPIFDSGDASAGRPQDEYEAASASTEIGSQSGDDDNLSLPARDVLLTFLLIIVAVVTAALIAMVI